MTTFTGRVALVAGASHSIGKGVAQAPGEVGTTVFSHNAPTTWCPKTHLGRACPHEFPLRLPFGHRPKCATQ